MLGVVLRLVCARQLARSTRRRALHSHRPPRASRAAARTAASSREHPPSAAPPGGGFATADHGELAAGRPHALAALARLGATSSPHARGQRAGDVDGGASCCLAREFRRAVLSRFGGGAAVRLRPNCPTAQPPAPLECRPTRARCLGEACLLACASVHGGTSRHSTGSAVRGPRWAARGAHAPRALLEGERGASRDRTSPSLLLRRRLLLCVFLLLLLLSLRFVSLRVSWLRVPFCCGFGLWKAPDVGFVCPASGGI